jgi:hypothetical protein
MDSWDSTLKMIPRQSYLHLKLDLPPPGTKSFSNLKIKVNTRFALNAFQGDCFNFSCFAQKIEIFSPKFLIKDCTNRSTHLHVPYASSKRINALRN